MDTNEPRLTLKEAADYSTLSVSTLRRFIDDGTLPASRLGLRRIVIARTDLDALSTPVTPKGATR
jgi:excisionase family DNA binding protein